MLSRFFIARPIFAWVLAIAVMLGGFGAVLTLPVAQYPDIAPPTVGISATYPGASAETVETSITQVIEQQLTGLDGMLYFSSSSSSAGQVTIQVTFQKGTNPDTAQVQVQNKVQQAVSRLPQAVQQQGIVVAKRQADQLMIVAIYDETDTVASADLSDYLVTNFQDPISRVDGIGATQVFGTQYAMRIWLDPYKLSGLQLMPSDVVAAIQAQNTEVSAGQIGQQPYPWASASTPPSQLSRVFKLWISFETSLSRQRATAQLYASAMSPASSAAMTAMTPTSGSIDIQALALVST